MKRLSIAVAVSAAVAFVSSAHAVCSPPFFGGTPGPMPAGTSPRSVVTGDFDGDGRIDLAVVASANPGMGVWFFAGHGDLTFSAGQWTPLGGAPTRAVAGYLNGDAHLDLAVIAPGDATIQVLLGDGAGSFAVSQTIPVLIGVNDIVLTDLNRDGALDIATSHLWSENSTTPGACTFVLGIGAGGNGTGLFEAPTTMTFNNGGDSIVAEDYDEDGILDLIVAQETDELRIFHGQGSNGVWNGTFQMTIFSGDTWGWDNDALAPAQIDNDGHLDLVSSGGDGLAMLFGNGDATFDRPAFPGQCFRDPRPIDALVIGDWNHDGKPDAGGVSSTAWKFAFGTNNGSGMSNIGEFIAPGTPVDVATADFDGNGSADLAIVQNSYNTVYVVAGLCTGASTGVEDVPASPGPALRVLSARRGSLEVEVETTTAGRLQLIDVSGRQVASTSVSPASGKQRFVWSYARRPAGVYLVRLERKTNSAAQKVVLTD